MNDIPIDSDVVVSGYRLTNGQLAFCRRIAAGDDIDEAGVRSGYTAAHGAGAARMLMTKPHIRKAIERLAAGAL